MSYSNYCCCRFMLENGSSHAECQFFWLYFDSGVPVGDGAYHSPEISREGVSQKLCIVNTIQKNHDEQLWIRWNICRWLLDKAGIDNFFSLWWLFIWFLTSIACCILSRIRCYFLSLPWDALDLPSSSIGAFFFITKLTWSSSHRNSKGTCTSDFLNMSHDHVVYQHSLIKIAHDRYWTKYNWEFQSS